MKELKDIEELHNQECFLDMLEHPEDFTEQELKDLLADETNRENLHVYLLLRKARNRRTIKAPDVNEAWKEFEDKQKPSFWSSRTFRLISIATTAAIFVSGFFLLRPSMIRKTDNVTALTAQNGVSQHNSKQILLQSSNGKTQSISGSTLTYASNVNAKNNVQGQTHDTQTITIPNGKDLKVRLSDGTEVMLNAGSRISFTVPFESDKREVNLTGEAYFNVKHDSERPFIVRTGKLNVTVLGTEFNVRSYANEAATVTLVKGLVNLTNEATNERILLHPNEEATLTGDAGHFEVSPADTYAVTQWTQGYFYYANAPLIQVVKDIARWYDMSITIRNSRHINTPIHFSACRNESIHQTIDNLNQLQKGMISVQGNTIVIQ